MKPIKWGIIGPGRIAGKFATGLKDVEGAELYAVASRSKSKAENFAQTHSATKAFGTYQEMLEDEALDVVYIATPHVFHHEHTLLCLKNGKAVLCEKPFAMNKNQVEEMIATARQEHVFLMEALWTQFLPHFKYLAKLVETNKYGKIKKLEADFGFHSPFQKEHRLYNKALGGGSLLDIGIYPVFLALSLLGKPQKIHAKASLGRTGVDEDCEVFFHYPENIKAKLNSSILEKTPTTALIEFEEAIVTVESRFHEPSTIQVKTSQGEDNLQFEVHSNGYNFEAAHVQEMLRQGRIESDEMTFEKSLQLISLLDSIRKEIKLEY